ncbi:helix-turn-helix domain-containing protein [Flavobacterium caeni]|uniref:HTH cro/C1-type domain-containing protein n=1 Tax=Flavobacterium caeni TaxID=490189 RepID=A0A1G5B2L2_9FLAO|nr:helix-turn-helix transcriptional regulator [Flavobacterium caeni]SCX84290.1 hypothetical protein SAMN02927903_00229 [Flavobacterium caeni]
MKKQNALRNLLGITQQEMAVLLNVNRSQWSMYEGGNRDLPAHAAQLLTEILMHTQSPDFKKADEKPANTAADRQWLTRLLAENEYQRLRLQREQATLEKQQHKQHSRQLLAGFVAHRKKTNKQHPWPLVAPKTATATQDHESRTRLLEYALRLEVLAFEKNLLESRLADLDGKTAR